MGRRVLAAVAVLALVAGACGAAQVLLGAAPQRYFGGRSTEWRLQGRAAADARVSLVFAVRQRDEQLLPTLHAVSHPRSPRYGRYLSLDEAAALTADAAALDAVLAYVRGFAVDSVEPTRTGDYVVVRCAAAVANAMLSADFHEFRHVARRARTLLRTQSYALPEHVAQYVDFVGHTVHFPTSSMRIRGHGAATARGSDGGDGYVTPEFLFKYYNITSPYASNVNATQSVYENLNQYINPDDVHQFQKEYDLTPENLVKIVGPNDPSACAQDINNCIEATLDVEYMMAVAQKAETWFWSIAGEQEPFLDWIVAVSNTPDAPLVHSISYGAIEDESDPSVVKRFDKDLAKLGVRGLTVVVSSGDDGVANFVARTDKSKCGFHPSYPATSPHVVAVGATQGPEDGTPEVACSSATGGVVTTGGGFSTIFDRPSYQDEAVQYYLNSGVQLPPSSMYNAKGRGYPDVAILGHNYKIYIEGQDVPVSGTSASAPVFAAMLTLINSARLDTGYGPVGYLNPTLYAMDANVFNDITDGENNCCAGHPGSIVCCDYGFYAAIGWDPLTGLGGVNFRMLYYQLTHQTPPASSL